MKPGSTSYRETQPPAPWVYVTVGAAVVVPAVALLVSYDRGGPAGLLPAGALVAFAAAILWLVTPLTIRVDGEGVSAALGRPGLFRTRIAWDDVVRAEAVTYRPLRQFGGWGLRFGWRGTERAWTMRGDRAVVLHLDGGMRVYLGSDRPERLLERMRAASGRRLEGAASGEPEAR